MKVNRDLAELEDGFEEKVRATIAMANAYAFQRNGEPKFPGFVKFAMFEGYRSQARQDYLYSLGRTKPGNKVTWRRKSNHTGRKAADICWKDTKDNWRWDGPDALWQLLGHCARKNGLVWGGDWKTTPDYPHVEAKG